MKWLKIIFDTFMWFLCPTCDHEAGICLKGQGRPCKFKTDDIENIERKEYHFKNEVKNV